MNHFFGRNLKIIRTEKKISQEALGKQFNKGQKTIGNWETGYSEPCIEELIRISDFFQVSIDALIKQEIKNNQAEPKNNQAAGKETNFLKKSRSGGSYNVELSLQESAKKEAAENIEVTWRDKYIALLENQLFETAEMRLPKITVQDLMTQMITIQKTLTELNR